MRILFLSNFYPPYELGGYEQLCQEVAVGLQNRGHDIRVLTSRFKAKRTSNINQENVSRTLHLQSDINYYRPSDFFLKRPYQERKNLLELRIVMNEFAPDLIFVWGMWNLSLTLPYWAEQWLPGRTVYYIASYWPIDENPHANYWKQPANNQLAEIVKKLLRTLAFFQLRREKYPPQLNFSRAICVSHYVRHTLFTVGILPSNASVIYNGINPAPFLPPETGQKTQNQFLRLLYSGRLIHDKGVHTALEALHLLKQQSLIDKVRLTVLGSGHPSYEATLRKMVPDYDLDNFVDFASFVPRTRMPDWLNQFDVYLFTSIWPEPMARSVMEAMAAGLLVIGSEVGGQTEMLNHGQNALTFQAEDAHGLANQIAYIIENPSLRLQMARAGQEMVLKKFTLDRMVTEIEAYLLQLRHKL